MCFGESRGFAGDPGHLGIHDVHTVSLGNSQISGLPNGFPTGSFDSLGLGLPGFLGGSVSWSGFPLVGACRFAPSSGRFGFFVAGAAWIVGACLLAGRLPRGCTNS